MGSAARNAVLGLRTAAFMAIPLLGSQARVPRRCPRAGVTDRTLCSLTLPLTRRSRQAQKRYPTELDVWAERAKQAPLRHPTYGPPPAMGRDGYAVPRRCGGSSGGGQGLPDSRPPQPFRHMRNPSPSSLTWRSPHLCQPNLHKILSMRSSLRRESLGVDHVRESSTSMTGTVVPSPAHAIRDAPGSSSSSAAITGCGRTAHEESRGLVAWRSAGVERECLVHADSSECDR